jgi:hypothetical protein
MTEYSGLTFDNFGYMPGNPLYPGAPPTNPTKVGKLDGQPTLALKDFSASAFSGSSVGGFIYGGNDWFMDTIHIKPQPVDFGSIFGPKLININVLPMFRDGRVVNLLSIDFSALGAGVSVTSNPPPLAFGLYQQRIIGITATPDGDPSFDDYTIWDFDLRDIRIRMLGTRLVPFTLDADMSDSINQTFGFVTDIMTAKRGDEQRVQLKEIPRTTQEFTVNCVDERDAQLLQSMLWGWQWRVFGVPIWQDAQRLSVALSPGATVINIPTTVGYDFAVGGIVFLWKDAHTWEAVTISAVNPTSLTTAPVAGTWAVRSTIVLPMKLGRLKSKEDVQWTDVDKSGGRFSFDMEASEE